MNAVQKKQWFFALRAVVVIIVLVLVAVANPVSAAQVRLDDGPASRTVRGSANDAPAAGTSSSLSGSSRAGEVEIYGVVEAINGSAWVIGGKLVTVSGSTEIKGDLGVGSQVKVHVTASADGSLTAREIEPALAAGGSIAPSDDDGQDDDKSGSGGRHDDADDDVDDNDDNSGSGSKDSDDDANDDNSGSGSDANEDEDEDNSGSGSSHDDDSDEDES